MLSDRTEENVLVIADGAAFGSQMERVMNLLSIQANCHIYLPESFEWIILDSDLLGDTEISEILKSPENHVESSRHFSWERYFTALLIEKNGEQLPEIYKIQIKPRIFARTGKESDSIRDAGNHIW